MGVGDHGDRVLSGGVEILEFSEGVLMLSLCLGLIAMEVLLCCLSRPYLCHIGILVLVACVGEGVVSAAGLIRALLGVLLVLCTLLLSEVLCVSLCVAVGVVTLVVGALIFCAGLL